MENGGTTWVHQSKAATAMAASIWLVPEDPPGPPAQTEPCSRVIRPQSLLIAANLLSRQRDLEGLQVSATP